MRTFDRLHHPDAGLLLFRLMLAAVFLFHGSQKLFGVFGGHGLEGTSGFMASLGIPLPWLAALLAALAELLGGAALATGLLFRPLLLPLLVTMCVAAFVAHGGNGFDAARGGMEYPLTLAVAVLALLLTGPGAHAFGGRAAPGAFPADRLDRRDQRGIIAGTPAAARPRPATTQEVPR